MTTAARFVCGLTVALSLLLCPRIYAKGEAGAQFLKIGVGAKPCAMGEAFVAVAAGPSTIYWNPGGMTQARGFQILAMHSFWLEEMSYEYLSAVWPSRYGYFGISAAYSPSGDIPQYEDFIQIGEYSAYDMAGTIAYANKVGWGISAGIGIKGIHQKIEEENASGFAVDLGVLYEVPTVEGLRFGCMVQHLGPGIAFIEESDPMPLNVKAGGGYRIGPMTVACDVNVPKDSDVRLNAGGEFVVMDILALRGGYNSAQSYSLGLGVAWMGVSIDYAYAPYGDVGDTHRIGAKFNFEEPETDRRRRGRSWRRGRRKRRR